MGEGERDEEGVKNRLWGGFEGVLGVFERACWWECWERGCTHGAE